MTAAYSCIKKAKHLQKSGFGRPRLVAVVCSLKCFEIGLICWQLISVKATKHLLGLPFLPKPGKCLAVSAFCRGRQHWISHRDHLRTMHIAAGKPPGSECVKKADQLLLLVCCSAKFIVFESVYQCNFLCFDNGQFTFRKHSKIAIDIKATNFQFCFYFTRCNWRGCLSLVTWRAVMPYV